MESATWVDANTGAPLTAGPASAAVPVVAAAAVTATSIVATPTTLSAGQTFVHHAHAHEGRRLGGEPDRGLDGLRRVVRSRAYTARENIPTTQTLIWSGCTAPATPQLLSISGFASWVDPNLPLVPHTPT